MRTARSASRTCSASSSAVEYTATASMPSSWSARMTRTAISPRFATRTRENITNGVERSAGERLEVEEHLPELDRLRVVDVDLPHDRLEVGLHLVHQLHRLEDAERLPRGDDVALLDERRRARLGGAVERPDHRRLDADEAVRRRARRGAAPGSGSASGAEQALRRPARRRSSARRRACPSSSIVTSPMPDSWTMRTTSRMRSARALSTHASSSSSALARPRMLRSSRSASSPKSPMSSSSSSLAAIPSASSRSS